MQAIGYQESDQSSLSTAYELFITCCRAVDLSLEPIDHTLLYRSSLRGPFLDFAVVVVATSRFCTTEVFALKERYMLSKSTGKSATAMKTRS